MTDDSRIQIYQSPDGETCVDVRFEQETVWLTQRQMVALFHRDVSVISRHIKNAVQEGEICEKSNLQKMQIAHSDKPVTLYDLDVVISVGYRVKSPQGVQFRRWATQRLRDYLIQGYAINRQRFEENAAELKQALALIQTAAQSPTLARTWGGVWWISWAGIPQPFCGSSSMTRACSTNPEGFPAASFPHRKLPWRPSWN